jgi:hypothetical protein
MLMRRAVKTKLLAVALLIAGCSDKVSHVQPVGGAAGSALHEERYLRRLFLDLTGAGPTDDQLAAAKKTLSDGADSAAARGAVVDTVLALPGFATNWVAELTNRVLAGQQLTDSYSLICASYRNFIVACQTCPMPSDPQASLCSSCDCAEVKQLWQEEQDLESAPQKLALGLTTSEIERLYGGSYLMQYSFADGNALADAMFQSFLAKKTSDDERRNASMISQAQPGSGNHGVLFHRYGGSFGDLVDIVFSSERYREGTVESVFTRYLGRAPTPVERAHFVAGLDASKPDVRPVIKAVVSSTEYFAQ